MLTQALIRFYSLPIHQQIKYLVIFYILGILADAIIFRKGSLPTRIYMSALRPFAWVCRRAGR